MSAAAAQSSPFSADKLAALDSAIEAAIREKKIPGGVLWIEQLGSEPYKRAYGNRTVVPEVETMTMDTIFDAASLSKIIVTSTAVMQLVEAGKLSVEDAVAKHIPAFGAHGKEAITVRHLLTHMSGLRPSLPEPYGWQGHAGAVQAACAEELLNPIGEKFVYSDIGFIMLGELIRVLSGEALEMYAQKHIFQPLKMIESTYLPSAAVLSRIAPCDAVSPSTPLSMLRGLVHDPTARTMGGVAGHAGVFTTMEELARFCRAILRGGDLDGERVLSAASVSAMLQPQNAPSSDARGFGWDVDTSFSGPRGSHFPAGRSAGHTGWTGGSVWLVPEEQLMFLFLSNRLHPDGPDVGDAKELRKQIGTLVAEAIGYPREANKEG
jgi:CubicO group peptidase (beta-lactamase class C family)